MATELGKAYVQIIPSARGIKSNIANELSGEVSSSGLALGKSLGAFMLKGLALLQIGKFFKDTINAGGSLEQSLGGVETLYKNSAQKVIDNAQKAYKTASMSANEYMQMSTSFAASLVSSTAGNTEKAAAIADMALIDMSDNANKMGSDMRSIQDAYQGFAKQQYQLLDNLKLGGHNRLAQYKLLKLLGTLFETISSQAYKFIGRFNDYSERKYTQVSGNREHIKI